MKLKQNILFISFLLLSLNFTSCNNNGKELFTNKSEYLTNEDIFIKAYASNNEAWVGLYRKDDQIEYEKDGVKKTTDSIRWYYVNDNNHSSGEEYSIQHYGILNESRKAFENLPAGYYKVVLFEKDYKIKEQVDIKITTKKLKKPDAPISATYTLKKNNGFANGTISLNFDKDNFYATDVIMYWANDDGILENYTSLAKMKVSNYECNIDLRTSSLIPTEATKLYIYAENNAGISENYYVIDLPENCQFKNKSTLLSRFQVVSDVHIAINDTHLASSDAKTLHDEHFNLMCKDITDFGNSDALIINGDIANSGRENEWVHTIELMNKYPTLPQTYFSLGNHDLYLGDYNTQISYFKKYAKTNSVYYEKEINGYHHLFLGSESSSYSSVDAYLSNEQLNWFDNKLAEYEKENKPVFVYLHQSLSNTVAGSLKNQGWNGITQDEQFRNIISKYKNVLFFNGHSHWDLNSYQTMYTKDDNLPNIFNTASVAYLWSSYYLNTGEYLKGSQGYYVEVYEDKILVLGRDFTNSKWIPSACFIANI